MRWLFLGAGNMASSLIGGLITEGSSPEHIGVMDPDGDACQRAIDTFGILAASRIEELMPPLFAQTDCAEDRLLGVVIAVKPAIVEAACKSMADYNGSTTKDSRLHTNAIYISVAAGVRVNSMQDWLPEGSALVRCMPNTPALLGLGITAMYANEKCSTEDKQLATGLLDSAGKTLWVEHESALDAVTAVSGSGPAYFFYLIEHMTSAGMALGLPADTAETLAIETAFGAASMARMRQHNAAVLRENVTSKGGTTAAALQVFNDKNTPEIIHCAMLAAQQRAAEMGDEFTPDVPTTP